MQFNNATDKEHSLYHDFLSLLGIPETDTTTIPVDGTFTRLCNKWYEKAVAWIWRASADWEYDDSNKTDLPVATTDLVATAGSEQQDYGMPTWGMDIERIEVMDEDGDYHLLTPMDKSMVKDEALTEFLETPGMPVYYDVIANSIFLYPKPNVSYVTESAGLKAYFKRTVTKFTPASTTVSPGFADSFHPICSVGPAFELAPKYAPHMVATLSKMLNDLKADLEIFYGRKHSRAMKPRFIPHTESHI